MKRTSLPDTMITQKISPKSLMDIADICERYSNTTEPEDYDQNLIDLGWGGGRLKKVVNEINKQIVYQIAVQSIDTSEGAGLEDDEDAIVPYEISFNCPLWSVITIASILRAEDESEDLPTLDLENISYVRMRVAWYPFINAATEISEKHEEEENQFLESWNEETE